MTLEESPYDTYDDFWTAMIAAGDPGPGAPNAQMWSYIVTDYDYINYRDDFTWEEFTGYHKEWNSFGIPGTDYQTLMDLYGDPSYFGAPPHLLVPPETDTWGWDMQLLGRKIIKSVKFIIDDQVLEEITADWCIIYDNMYQTESQKYTANTAYNRNIVGANRGKEEDAGKSESRNKLFIHIPFFFSQSYAGDVYSNNKQNKTPFPLCAIHKQKIMLEIDFFKQSFFTINHPEANLGGDIGRGRTPLPPTPPAKKLLDFYIITEEITLSNEESLFFKTNNGEIIYDFVNKHTSMQLETNEGKRSFEIQLEPSIPVKCFHWFYRYKGYEDEDEYRHIESTDLLPGIATFITSNRFNFTKAQYSSHAESIHILKRAYFSLNGERFPNIANIDHEYFFTYVPMQSQLSTSGNVVQGEQAPAPVGTYRLNYIYSYNFAMYPKSTMPSGFLDFSRLNSDKTKLHFELNDDLDILHGGNRLVNPEYTFHLYYTGFRVLRFNDGFVSIT